MCRVVIWGSSGSTLCRVSNPMGLFCVCISASDFWEVPGHRGSMIFVESGVGLLVPQPVEDFLQGPLLLGKHPAGGLCPGHTCLL